MIRNSRNLTFAAFVLVPLLMGSWKFVEPYAPAPSNTDAALATAARFYELLGHGDSAGAARLLAPDAVVLESGEIETRAQYIAHHLGADIEFAKAVPAARTIINSRRDGNVVWIVAESVSKGRFRERQIDSRGAELTILTATRRGWLIRALHWSSRRMPPTR
jgi:ketosteroid isomerase-like protein